MSRKRLILFVEGEGDTAGVPALVKKLLSEGNAWGFLTLDEHVFKVGGIQNLTGRKAENWTNKLRAAVKRSNVGAILLVLDGDRQHVLNDQTRAKDPFCAADVARRLAQRARDTGAGSTFSVACVFARQEFESWLLAGIGSLRGKSLPDGRPGIRADAVLPAGDTDTGPRNAKDWLAKHMPHSYKASTDQGLLATMVTLQSIRQTRPRSFERLEHAVEELCGAIRTEEHLVSPVSKPSGLHDADRR